MQRAVHADRVAGLAPDTILFLEHQPVFTAGKRTEDRERPVDGTAVVDVDRGGKITFHGPGQLVAYPIVQLPEHVGVVDFVRRIEEAMIRTIADFGISSGRVPGRSGVWLPADAKGPERKIGAVGIRVAGGVSMHGLSLNADVDLSWFDRIIPCGIDDAGVTSITTEIGRDVRPSQVADVLAPHLTELLQWKPYEKSADIVHSVAPGPSVLGVAS